MKKVTINGREVASFTVGYSLKEEEKKIVVFKIPEVERSDIEKFIDSNSVDIEAKAFAQFLVNNTSMRFARSVLLSLKNEIII